MPPLWCAGSWLLYFLIQVNYLTTFAFNLALGNPSVRDDDSITISCHAGKMRFWRVGPDSYTLSLRLNGGEFAYNLTVVLRATPLETQERPTSSAETIEEYAPIATPIPPLPVHTLSNLLIVPPGAPFRVPCPRCQSPLETGEICQNHFSEGITLIRQGPEAPLEEHHRVPFLFLQSSCHQPNFLVESDSTRATRATSPASSDTLSPDISPSIPISRHACYRAPSPHLPADVPAGELRIREGMGREGNGDSSSSRSGIPRPATRRGGENIRTLRNPPGGHTSGDRTHLENSRNTQGWCTVGNDGGPSLPVPLPVTIASFSSTYSSFDFPTPFPFTTGRGTHRFCPFITLDLYLHRSVLLRRLCSSSYSSFPSPSFLFYDDASL